MNTFIKLKYIRIFSILLLLSFGSFFITSCGGDPGPQPDLAMWTGMGGEELIALKEITERFNSESGLYVSVINVPFNELRIKYQIAAPAGQGPDLLSGPQDWIGALATADLITPLSQVEFTPEQRNKYNPIGLENMTYNREIYGIPFFLETIAVIYNTDIIKVPPETMDQLIQDAVTYNDRDQNKYGFFFEVNNMYFAWPFLAGYGAEIFAEKDGKLQVDKVLLNSPETIEGLRLLSGLKNKYDIIPSGATTDMMNGIFYERNMPFCLNGPWMLGEIKKKEIPFDVMPLPVLPNGQPPRPFVGVQGIMLNKQAKNRDLAVRFMHFLNRPENQKILCLAAGRIPSRYDTLEELHEFEAIHKFAKAAELGTPMPNHPAMNAVWTPMNEALTLIINDGIDPEKVLPEQVKRIEEDIRLMME
ncbi:MAG: extracellular solute-binding protein [Vulcanimicrobiota bacterium]